MQRGGWNQRGLVLAAWKSLHASGFFVGPKFRKCCQLWVRIKVWQLQVQTVLSNGLAMPGHFCSWTMVYLVQFLQQVCYVCSWFVRNVHSVRMEEYQYEARDWQVSTFLKFFWDASKVTEHSQPTTKRLQTSLLSSPREASKAKIQAANARIQAAVARACNREIAAVRLFQQICDDCWTSRPGPADGIWKIKIWFLLFVL